MQKIYRNFFDNQMLFFRTYIFIFGLYAYDYLLLLIDNNVSLGSLFFGFFSSCILAAFLCLIAMFPKKISRYLMWLSSLISCAVFLIDIFCWITFEAPLSATMLITAFETNLQESLSFVELYFNFRILGAFLLTSLYAYLCFFVGNQKTFKYSGGGGLLFLSPFVLLGLCFALYDFYTLKNDFSGCQYKKSFSFLIPMRQICAFNLAFNDNKQTKDLLDKLKTDFQTQSTEFTRKNKIENIVLILGESTQKNHMQIYGYDLPTTPNLAKLDTKNLIIYNNVISPHAQTTLSLRKVLTFLNYENEDNKQDVYTLGNLITLFNQANYSTFWISNQLGKTHGGVTSVIATSSKKYNFASQYKQNFEEVFHDGKLLPIIDMEQNSNKEKYNLFVIHLMGTHASYGNRYPPHFSFFDDSLYHGKKQRTIARYDNAVLYNDYVVSEIIKKFTNRDAIVIYISDHGEELYENNSDFAGHSDDRISKPMVEIPMLVYVSDLFIQNHPILYTQLQSSVDSKYMTDDLIHTILDIAGIKTLGFDPTRSIINQKFNPNRIRMIGGKNGKNYDAINR
ncbi:hypothetical protein BBW65_04085 [Helicobacter enhydrae]|uniref:Sulfatase N-terminal domain-containing protein n=1 Tax=Helicobacter enhydrae TaxID=222136 RepID=A0A1B1U5K2_9HELI|nr:phosphoethanolamine transferase [Helicobacter enhydrae]ANV98030.1 hypothetical protein BBW65_04085 [Helicobacter enhydrae]